jgi:hypothetical protein
LEFPVCTFDLRTGVLCSKCEAKLRGGELTQTDLTVMKALLEHERHDPRISSLSYVRSFRLNNKLFVVLREGGQAVCHKKFSKKCVKQYRGQQASIHSS